jgi:hypothetical protein
MSTPSETGPVQKLFIPACGDRLVLAAPWTFRLFLEHRNIKFAEQLKLYTPKKHTWSVYGTDHKLKCVDATLPEGPILECDRVYIKGFNKSRVKEAGNPDEIDYDSITWKMIVQTKGRGGTTKEKAHGRFWSKLSDVCQIQYRLEWDAFFWDRIKAVRQVMET